MGRRTLGIGAAFATPVIVLLFAVPMVGLGVSSDAGPAHPLTLPGSHPTASAGSPTAALRPAIRSLSSGFAGTKYGPFDGHVYNTTEKMLTGSVNGGSSVALDNRTGTVFLASGGVIVTSFSETTGAVRGWARVAPVSAYIDALAIDRVHNNLYVGVTPVWPGAAGFVLVLNESTLALVANISAFGSTSASLPVSTVIDPSTNQSFVQDARTGAVAIINTTSHAVRTVVRCPGSIPICAGGGLALFQRLGASWVAAATLNRTLYFVNPSTDAFAGTLTLPPNSTAGTPTYDSVDHYLYVTNYTGFGLIVYDSSLAYVRTVAPLGSYNPYTPSPLLYDPAGNWVVYSQPGPTGLWLINGTSGAVVRQRTLLEQPSAFRAGAVDPSSGIAVMTSDTNNSTVSFSLANLGVRPAFPQFLDWQVGTGVDAGLGMYYAVSYGLAGFFGPARLIGVNETTNTVAWSIPVASSFSSTVWALAVDPTFHHVFVSDNNQTVYIYAGASGAAAGVISLPANSFPEAMDVDAVHHLLYVVETGLNRTAVVNTATLGVNGVVSTPGLTACAVAADPTHTAAFETNCRAPGGNVTEIFGSPLQRGGSLGVGRYPGAIVVNSTGYVFVGNSGSENISVVSPSFGLSSFSTGGGNAIAFALSPDSTSLFASIAPVANYSIESTITVFNTTGRGLVGQFGSIGVTGYMAVDPVSGLLVAPEIWNGLTFLAYPLPLPPAPLISAVAGNSSAEVFITGSLAQGATVPFQYNVSVGQGPSGPWLFTNNTSALNLTFRGLHNGQTYYVIATGESFGGTGPSSSPISVVPASIPYPPTSPSASATSGSVVDVFWGYPASSGGIAVLNYSVLYSDSPQGPWASVSTGSAAGLSFNVSGLAAHTTYYFRVLAWNHVGSSHPSTVASATTKATTSSGGSGAAGTIGGFPIWYPVGVLAIIVAAIVGGVVVSRRDRQRAQPTHETPDAPA